MEYKYITSESLEFLKQLLNTPSTSGGEKEIAKLYSKYMEPYGNTIIDNMHNSCCVINPTSEFKVMLDAHYDEVGMQVVHIAENAGCPGKGIPAFRMELLFDRFVFMVGIQNKLTLWQPVEPFPDPCCPVSMQVDSGLAQIIPPLYLVADLFP